MPRITKRLVDATLPNANGGDVRVWDSEIKGFVLRVRRGGGKSYQVFYRHGGEQRWGTIGKHGSPWTPETARVKAAEILRDVALGQDPHVQKIRRRADMTVGDLIKHYLEEGPVDKPNKRASSWDSDRSNLERHAKPLLGRKRLCNVTMSDVASFQRDVANGKSYADVKTKKRGRAIVRGGPGTARRSVETIAAMFNWARKRGLMDANPARDVEKFRTQPKERFLTQEEMTTLFETLQTMDHDGAVNTLHISAIRLLALTGCRKSEIIGLRWSEIDWKRQMIALPHLRSKTGAKRIPISSAAIAELNKLPRVEDHVFPAGKDGESPHVVGLQRSWEKVRARAKLPDVRLHDLRHTFASMAVDAGESLYVVQKALGHKRATTTERYAHLRDDPVRAMVERLGDRIDPAKPAAVNDQ